MDTQAAIKIIRSEDAIFTDQYKAVNALIESNDATLIDLLDCLKLPGVCAEIAAIRLYEVTERAKPQAIDDASFDYFEWRAYLVENGLIKS